MSKFNEKIKKDYPIVLKFELTPPFSISANFMKKLVSFRRWFLLSYSTNSTVLQVALPRRDFSGIFGTPKQGEWGSSSRITFFCFKAVGYGDFR
ncbi:MAG: hypothetical protein HC836_47100 [Richelia sp. RM2_1_2]|nr:hypothetical protein [Richelia sp. RM2_1_2]